MNSMKNAVGLRERRESLRRMIASTRPSTSAIAKPTSVMPMVYIAARSEFGQDVQRVFHVEEVDPAMS